MSGPAPTYVPFELVSSFEFASGVAMGVLTGLGYIALGAISEALRGGIRNAYVACGTPFAFLGPALLTGCG